MEDRARFDRIEQGQARAELHRVDRTEDLLRGSLAGPAKEGFEAAAEAWAKEIVRQIGPRLVYRGDPVILRRGTASERSELGKDEPHPVADFRSGAQLGDDLLQNRLLSVDESLEL